MVYLICHQKWQSDLGGSVESWMRLQETYDLWKARGKVDIEKLNRIYFDKVA